jgi:hypothetical protein
MELLSRKTSAKAEKGGWIYLGAYNLIQLMIPQQCTSPAFSPLQVKSKHPVELWSHWDGSGLDCEDARLTALLLPIFQPQVGSSLGKRGGGHPSSQCKRRAVQYPPPLGRSANSVQFVLTAHALGLPAQRLYPDLMHCSQTYRFGSLTVWMSRRPVQIDFEVMLFSLR